MGGIGRLLCLSTYLVITISHIFPVDKYRSKEGQSIPSFIPWKLFNGLVLVKSSEKLEGCRNIWLKQHINKLQRDANHIQCHPALQYILHHYGQRIYGGSRTHWILVTSQYISFSRLFFTIATALTLCANYQHCWNLALN